MDNANKKQRRRPLSINLQNMQRPKGENIHELVKTSRNNAKLLTQNKFKDEKQQVIKQIINDYFQEEIQCDQLMQHNINRIARRTQRIRKVPEIGKKVDHKPASE